MNNIRNWCGRHCAPLLLIGVCFMVMFFLSLATHSFFSLKNIVNILEANSYRLILAIGMMCVMASGAIDLSVGSILSFSAICMAKLLKAGLHADLSIAFALILGAAMGSLNGMLIYITRLNAFIITLATSFMYRGLSLIVTQGIPITKLPQAFRNIGCGNLLGMETGVTMAFASMLLLIPLFYHMRWGHYLMSLGGNPDALARSGVPIGRYRVSVFAYMGMLSALSGVIITARLNSAEANAGLSMEMDAICAVIMGGTALHGGNGNLLGTVIAVFLLGLIRNGLTIMSVSSYYQQFITGFMLLCAVVIAELRERQHRVSLDNT